MEQEKSREKKPKSGFDEILKLSIPIDYVSFIKDTPRGRKQEPVSEFVLKSDQIKYLVESLTWTPYGVIWTCLGKTNLAPLSNVRNCGLSI